MPFIEERLDVLEREIAALKAIAGIKKNITDPDLKSVETIKSRVALAFNLSPEDINRKNKNLRIRAISWPRHIALYFCKKLLPQTTDVFVCAVFGGLHHKMVNYAFRTVTNRIDTEPETRKFIKTLEDELRPLVNPSCPGEKEN